jgi:hypothetical protein
MRHSSAACGSQIPYHLHNSQISTARSRDMERRTDVHKLTGRQRVVSRIARWDQLPSAGPSIWNLLIKILHCFWSAKCFQVGSSIWFALNDQRPQFRSKNVLRFRAKVDIVTCSTAPSVRVSLPGPLYHGSSPFPLLQLMTFPERNPLRGCRSGGWRNTLTPFIIEHLAVKTAGFIQKVSVLRTSWNVRFVQTCLPLLVYWRMVSSGLLRRVALVRTDVSEELSSSFIRVTRIVELDQC